MGRRKAKHHQRSAEFTVGRHCWRCLHGQDWGGKRQNAIRDGGGRRRDGGKGLVAGPGGQTGRFEGGGSISVSALLVALR